ncbi:MAG: tetratricopeptide repeat protein [Patescibacteria group bacterium]|jgi:tetratricopeptide (TPR) repeat protein
MWRELVTDFWRRFWWGLVGIIVIIGGIIWLTTYVGTVEVSGYRVSQADAEATNYYAAGEIDQAQAAYETITKNHPNDWFAWNGLGNIYRDKGQYGSAEIAYLKALKINPQFEQGYRNIYNLYYAWSSQDATQLSKAEPVLLDGIKYLPKSEIVLEEILNYYQKIGNQEQFTFYQDKLNKLRGAIDKPTGVNFE